MGLRNNENNYGCVAKGLHWLMALAIIALIAVGFYMSDLPNNPDKFKIYGLHKATGFAVLIFVTFRIIWRWTNIIPPLPDNLPSWQGLAAHVTHYALYGLMFAMPLSGWLMSSAAGFPISFYGLFQVPDLIAPNKELVQTLKDIHQIGALAFCAMLFLHIGAALQHHFIIKDNILKRMLP